MNSIIEWLLGPGAKDRLSFTGVENWRISFVAKYADDNVVRVGLLLLFAGMTFLTIRSYRREGNVHPRAKAVLATIRIIVIALVIILILQPGIFIREEQTLRSYLVVLIDDSRSMSFKDTYTGEQADTLRELLYPRGVEDPRGADPAGPAGQGRAPRDPLTLDETSRKDIVRRLLSRRGSALARLAREHPLIIMRFATTHAGAKNKAANYTSEMGSIPAVDEADDDKQGDKALLQPPPALAEALNELTGKGDVTDIGQAVHDALAHVQGRRLAGLVIISDGQITNKSKRRTDRLASARKLAADRRVPLYSICVGDPTPPKKLSVVSLTGPSRIRPGSGVEFSASITHRGYAGQRVIVRLLSRPIDRNELTPTGVEETVTLKSTKKKDDSEINESTEKAVLKLTPEDSEKFAPEDSEKLTPKHYVFRAVIDPPDGEVKPDDKVKRDDKWAETPPIRVTDKRIHVLLVSGDAGWEFQYLRNYLLRSPATHRLSVWQQNLDKKIDQIASSKEMKLDALPDSLGKLMGVGGDDPKPGYDLVILYDPKPGVEGFDAKFVDNLKTYVKRGKGLCYIAGNKYTDYLLRDDDIANPLKAMLPVKVSANTFSAVERIERQHPEPWQVRVTREGLDHQLTRLGSSSEKTRRDWDLLPGMFWTHPVAKAKRLAVVLLENTNPSRRTLDNKPEPVLAVHFYGDGRVVYVGMDATWRWRCVDDGFYHRRFWANCVEYLATSSARSMVITTGGSVFTSDKRITVNVEAYDPQNNYDPLVAKKLVLLMTPTDEEGDAVELVLLPVDGEDGNFRLTIDAPPVGTYDLTPKESLGGVADDESKIFKQITIGPPMAEYEHRQADPAAMEELASKKNALPIHRIDELAEMVPPLERRKVRRSHKTLWDCRLSLLLVVTLLCAEWILRKKYNMA